MRKGHVDTKTSSLELQTSLYCTGSQCTIDSIKALCCICTAIISWKFLHLWWFTWYLVPIPCFTAAHAVSASHATVSKARYGWNNQRYIQKFFNIYNFGCIRSERCSCNCLNHISTLFLLGHVNLENLCIESLR